MGDLQDKSDREPYLNLLNGGVARMELVPNFIYIERPLLLAPGACQLLKQDVSQSRSKP